MRRTILAVFAGLLISGGVANANPTLLKSNVVIVKPQYHEATRRAFNEWATKLSRLADDVERANAKNAQVAAALRGLGSYYSAQAASPGHGSGWIWYGPDGTPYVITNRHVAGQAGSVSIEFDQDRHPRITDGNIIYVDPVHDMAVIEVPARELPREARGFQLIKTTLTEGNPVWAAGFPGTATMSGQIPVYSLTNGIVSNAEFPGPEGRAIAHTATIDPGNSGGPLLAEEPTTALGYRIAGMNTWKANARSNVNLALPASTIATVLKSALEARATAGDRERLASALHATATRLADELGSSRPDLVTLQSMISYSFVAQRPGIIGLPIELLLKGKLSRGEFERFLASPVEYSREVLWTLFFTTFSTGSSNVGAVRLLRITDEDRIGSADRIRSVYEIAGKRQEIVWAWEHGAWRIADASFEQALTTSPTSPQETATPAPAKTTRVEKKAEKPFVKRAHGLSVGLRLGLGSYNASGVNGFASDFESQSSQSIDVELAYPLSENIRLTVGAGYDPLGAYYPVTVDGNQIWIDEQANYLQLPAGVRAELPIARKTGTFIIYGRGAFALDVLVDKAGSFDNGTGSQPLTGPGVGWYDEHNTLNVAALFGGGFEVGLGRAPHYYLGLDLGWQRHLLNEWTDQFFTGGANYRYNAMRVGITLTYQGLR